jgi:photosystem II stability/assembly factor-like uncharacterized protein
VRIAADRVNPKKFYAFDPVAGVTYRSDDGAANFATTQRDIPKPPDWKLGAALMRAVPEREGEVWIASFTAGVFRSRDSAATFERVAGVDEPDSVGFGKVETGRAYPTVYAIAKIGGVAGFFRSDDAGRSFVRINDDSHQFGGGLIVVGDPRVSGRVYLGTHGRGIWYGEPRK